MARSVYVAGSGPRSGKSVVALGLHDAMTRSAGRVGVFRPVVPERHLDASDPDLVLALLRERGGSRVPYEACVGVPESALRDLDSATASVVERYRALEREHDAVVVVGSDFRDVAAPVELGVNAHLAVNLGAPVLVVASGDGLDPTQVVDSLALAVGEVRGRGGRVLGLVANRVAAPLVDEVSGTAVRSAALQDLPVRVLADEPLLSAPTVRAVLAAVHGELAIPAGGLDPALLDVEAASLLVAAMRLPHVLERLREGTLVITAGDREDVLVGLLAAQQSGAFPLVSGIVLSGGFGFEPAIAQLVEGLAQGVPLAVSDLSTVDVVDAARSARGALGDGSTRKVDTALALADARLGADELLGRLHLQPAAVTTPLMFAHAVLERAREHRQRIVLPEGTEPRVLTAAERVLRLGVADLVLLGDPAEVAAAATSARVDVSAAAVVDPREPALRERLAEAYAERRAAKGVTLEIARDRVLDVSYAGTLLVALDEADGPDGMVSGAAHTTAHTIRPALELLRAGPVVSSVFLMCLPDRVLVYGDCAVVPDPTAEQLAAIAVDAAATARAFGVDPRVALLSYSTGESGSGADVEKVREATRLARERAPELPLEGPLQYDAAVDPAVAATKLPGSAVAGRATVLVFPDLNTGNTTYKAVQRSSGAVAVGPVLQGLTRPVNDLSRGATVEDIVMTIAVTAVQAAVAAQLPATTPTAAVPA